MKVVALLTISAVLGLFLAMTALKTAYTIASVQVKREAILEIN